ncbi:MAG TPA: alpha-2-macroglobulin [Crinalium sp.]
MSIRRWIRVGVCFSIGLILAFSIGSCGAQNFFPGNQPLAEVSPLPLPKLPDWIEQISPTDQADPLAQIRIRFKEPLIPVESLENPDQQDTLKLFEISPALPGQFRFLTPRMVGFQADQALPKATRVRVTLKSGLADLKNHRLEQDLAWTFNTEAIALTNLPGITLDSGTDIDPFPLKPSLEITSNVELDLASLQEHVSLKPDGQEQGVGLQVALKEETAEDEDVDNPQATFDPSQRSWIYTVTLQSNLTKATRYKLEFAPGLKPAHGNLPSETAFSSQIPTYGPLAFEALQFDSQPDAGGAYGRFVKGNALLKFSNGLVAESALKAIKVEPPPKEAPRLLQAYDGDRTITLNPWSLNPATTYTITVDSSLKDKFGQSLEKPVTVQYETGDVAADIWAPSNLNIFPVGVDLQLNISAVNLPESNYKAAYRVVKPTDLVYFDSAYPRGEGGDLLPNSASWPSLPLPNGQKNQSTEIAVPLRERLGGSTGMLAYGVTAKTYRYKQEGKELWREPEFYGLVQLTNLGVFSQWFPESGLIRVHHLSDGSAAAGAKVEVYRSQLEAKSRSTPTPCATGITDPTGTLVLTASALQSCMQGNRDFSNPPNLLTVAYEGPDWAAIRTLEWSGDYGYGLYAGWNGDQPESRGTIFSDRQLYQPGETAWFTGAAYYLKNGTLQQDKNVRYAVTLEDPDGNQKDLGNQNTNEFGTFSVEWAIAPNQPLGYYTIRAKGDSGAEISGDFRIAEFKPPNFKVDLTLDKQTAQIGDTITAQAQSNYLFGPPVESGKVDYYVTREQADFSPGDWGKDFSFGRRWFWPEEAPSVSSDVLQVSGNLDPQGKGSQAVKVADDLPYPMTYRFDAQVTDVSNLSVADSKTFVALPSDRLIGLQSDFVATAGKPFEVKVVVVNPKGEAIANQPVRVELQQMIYSSVTQVIEGSQTGRDQVEYKTVAQAEVRSGNAPEAVSLVPTESGSYRIRANFANARNELTATDVQIWATGDNPVSWGGRYSNERLELQLDKDTYRPGETARVLIQSPYPEAELYFAVIRNNTIYKTVTKVRGGAPEIQFQVTPDMIPNAAVEAVLVRQGEPLQQVESDSLDKLVRIGFAPFATNLDDQYLKVQVKPGQESVQPGAEQTVQLTLTTPQGQPAQGQFTVMAVNEAVLQLTDYRPPNLVDTVYAEQPISTRFADNRPDVVLQPLSSPIDKGWGYGGGRSAGAGSNRVRTNFKPLAYYNGSVRTDASGNASVTFTLPDDLTTWRVMAVATDGQLHFGNGDATFITTKPLMANPVLPQFARPGDRLEAGLSVTNTTGQSGNLAINGTISGSLQLADNASPSLQTQAPSGTSAYRFPVVAGNAGEGKVQFTAQLNGNSDGFEVPLTIKPLEITEQVVETGTTTTQVQIPLKIDNTVVNDAGGLDISLASTLIPELKAPARQVLDEEQLPFLEPAASQLAIAANLQILSRTYGQTFGEFNPAQQATKALERLSALQRSDGGFAAYPGQEQSDPFVSPYAAQSLAIASDAGFTVNSGLVSRLKAYLQKILADPGQYDYCKQQVCKDEVRLGALLGLADLGDRRTDFLSDLYQRRAQFDPVTQIKLARYLAQFSEWQQESAAMANQIQENVYETGRTAAINLPQDWRWFSSPSVAQSQALRLFISGQTEPDTLDRLAKSLLDQRRNGTWGSTYDNAEALTALVAYGQLQSTPPSFSAIAQLAGKTVASAQFQGYQRPSVESSIPMANLPRGDQALLLKKTGNGTLHYLAAYRYRLQGNPPGRFNGLRVTREIRPANQTDVLKRMGLTTPNEPLTVKPGQVFDIELEVIADHPVDHLVITDPLPAGFEAVDTSFQTSTPYFQSGQDSWEIGYQTIYSDRVVAYGNRLEAGVYTFHYLVRSVTPGTYLYPGSEVHLQYSPEEFGRSASATLKVEGG